MQILNSEQSLLWGKLRLHRGILNLHSKYKVPQLFSARTFPLTALPVPTPSPQSMNEACNWFRATSANFTPVVGIPGKSKTSHLAFSSSFKATLHCLCTHSGLTRLDNLTLMDQVLSYDAHREFPLKSIGFLHRHLR